MDLTYRTISYYKLYVIGIEEQTLRTAINFRSRCQSHQVIITSIWFTVTPFLPSYINTRSVVFT